MISVRCALLAAAAMAAVATACTPKPQLTLIIRGGTVVDGRNDEPRVADVGVDGARIAVVGDLAGVSAPTVIDATGRVVAPGFVDVDSATGVAALVDPTGGGAVLQGITTQVIGAENPAYWTPATADAAALRCLGVTVDWQGFDGYAARLQNRGPTGNLAITTPMAAARASGNIGAFLDAELPKGSFGVASDAVTTREEIVAAMPALQKARTPLALPWTLVANSDPEWVGLAADAGAFLVTHTWTEPRPSLAAMRSRLEELNGRALAFAVIAPSTEDPAPIRDKERLKGGFLFSSDRPTPPCAAPVADDAPAAVLADLTRHQQALTLAAAVRRLSFLPADLFGMYGRGAVQVDYFADLVVFDPQRIAPRTASAPMPAGLDYVIVNGVIAATAQGLTGARAGRVLRHAQGPG